MLNFKGLRKSKVNYEFDIQPRFPSVEVLLDTAERCTNSCVHLEQVGISRNFFKAVAIRGAYSKRYSLEEVKRAAVLIDYMAEVRARQLDRYETSENANLA